MTPRLTAALAALLTSAAVTATLAGVTAEVRSGFVSEDNIGRAQRPADRESDAAFALAGSLGGSYPIGGRLTLSVRATFEGRAHDAFTGLDRRFAGASVSLRRKAGLGATSPWIQFAAAAEQQEFQDRSRDGVQYEGRAAFGWSAGLRWNFRTEGSWTRREAETPVFDATGATLSLHGDVALPGRSVLFGSIRSRRGDVASSGTPDAAIAGIAEVSADDPVFGPGIRVWRLDARSHMLLLGWSLPLGRHGSIQIEHERLVAMAEAEIDYRANLLRATYLYRW